MPTCVSSKWILPRCSIIQRLTSPRSRQKFARRKSCVRIGASRAFVPSSKPKPCSRLNSERNSLITLQLLRTVRPAALKTHLLRKKNQLPRSLSSLQLPVRLGGFTHGKCVFDAQFQLSRSDPIEQIAATL